MAALTREQANTILSDHFAPWVLALGIKAEILTSDSATLRIPISASLTSAGGAVCAQALTSAADAAMVIAVSSAMGGYTPLTIVDLSINYTGVAMRGDALLEAKVVRRGRAMVFCTAEIREAESGEPAAFVTGTYAVPKS